MKRKPAFAVTAAVLTFGVGIAVVAINLASINQKAQAAPGDAKAPTAYFAELNGGAPGWRVGPQSSTSFLMFANGTDCFFSLNRESAGLNIAKAQSDHASELMSTGSTLTTASEQSMTMESRSGRSATYALKLYGVTGTDTYPNQAYGFADLGSEVVKVIANCSTPDGLQSAITILPSVRVTE